MQRKFKAYKVRDRLLRKLGFKSYRDYLKSDLWQEVRRRVFERWGRFCLLCGEPATQVHHNSYCLGTLFGTYLKPLKPICAACHRNLEFNEGRKRTMKAVKEVFCATRREGASDVKARSEINRLVQLFDYEEPETR